MIKKYGGTELFKSKRTFMDAQRVLNMISRTRRSLLLECEAAAVVMDEFRRKKVKTVLR